LKLEDDLGACGALKARVNVQAVPKIAMRIPTIVGMKTLMPEKNR
jgi:hypothetical protein